MQTTVLVDGDLLTIPQIQHRPSAPALEVIVARHECRNAAIAAAYATGIYSYREIAEYFGIYLSTVSRIVRADTQQ